MQTLVVAALLYEIANKAGHYTGGGDGLQGMSVWPVFGLFRFDMFAKTAYLYSLAVLFVCWLLMRTLVHSAFGRSLMGIRENVARMHAIGTPVERRKLIAYTIAAALAGVSGALIAQTTAFVGLGVLSLERSGSVLIMLIIGGVGQLVWGVYRRADVHDRAGSLRHNRPSLLVFLDRLVHGAARVVRARGGARHSGACRCVGRRPSHDTVNIAAVETVASCHRNAAAA